jgi:hypothetical protein
MKHLKTYEENRITKFKEGDWVVAENMSTWYNGIWDNLLDFLKTTPGQIMHFFDIGGISYNVLYFNKSTEEEFNQVYYNDNSIAYGDIDRNNFKIYDINERYLRFATPEEIELEKNKISLEVSVNKYNL